MREIDKRHENKLFQAREENHIDIVVVEHQRRMLLSNLTHTHSCYQEKIIILLIIFSLVIMDLSDAS